jgi:hypothetical protein
MPVLDRMAKRVTEIEQRTHAGFGLVLAHDLRFDLAGTPPTA